MNDTRVLIVDDDDSFRSLLGRWLTKQGYEVIEASDPSEGEKKLFSDEPQLIFWDLRFPSLNNNEDESLEIVGKICSERPGLPVIIATNHGSIEKAVRAIRDLGVYDFLEKSLDYDKLRVILRNASEKYDLHNRVEALGKHVEVLEEELESLREKYPEIIGESPVIVKVLNTIEKVANTDATVLVTGDTGTGKELVAHALHDQSSRKGEKFVTVNCAAIPKDLLESELFGHEKGAFTGATRSTVGKFQSAHKGTIFLDEIGEMESSLQAKLLRVIQDGEIEKIGRTEPIKVNVRVVAATNRDLEKEVEAGRFREDLYFRLNVLTIQMPPQRERKDDIRPLAEHFLQKYRKATKREVETIHPETMKRLAEYDWPGNVRELENAIQRAVILTENKAIQPHDLPEALQPETAKDRPYVPLLSFDELEKLQEEIETET